MTGDNTLEHAIFTAQRRLMVWDQSYKSFGSGMELARALRALLAAMDRSPYPPGIKTEP